MNSIICNGFYPGLEKWFEGYTAGFDHSDPRRRFKFDLKREHSQMVARESAAIAAAIGLAPEDVALAKVIGLLHDIGRFPQVARFMTFDDRASVDHGELGAAVIRDHGLLAPLAASDVRIIETAVRCHNRPRLPDLEDGRLRLFAQLIRDADKLDIFRVIRDLYLKSGRPEIRGLPQGDDISEDVLADLLRHDIVRNDHLRNQVDLVFFRLGWLFDINFSLTLRMIQERGYYAMLCAMLPTTANTRTALNEVEAYLAASAAAAAGGRSRGAKLGHP